MVDGAPFVPSRPGPEHFTDSELDDADCQADCSGDCGGLTFAALLCWDNAAPSGERRGPSSGAG